MISDLHNEASETSACFLALGRALALFWGCRSIFWRPSSVLRSNLACLSPILLAGALPRTPWASFLEAETG